MKTHYEILGVRDDDNLENIKKAYQTLILQHHPDKNGGIESTDFTNIVKSWKVLSNPDSRKVYDSELALQRAIPNYGLLESQNVSKLKRSDDGKRVWIPCHRCAATMDMDIESISEDFVIQCDDCSTQIWIRY